MRCAQVREPTTRKNASWILRCSQTIPVSPQNTSRWPLSRRTALGAIAAPAVQPCTCAFMPAPGNRGSHRQRDALVAARGAQLQNELRGVDEVGRVGRQREQHLLARIAEPGEQRHQIGGVQRQHEEAEDVFPEEGRRKQIAAEDFALPDRAGDHDRVKQQRLDHDRCGRDGKSLARWQVADDQARLIRKTANWTGARMPCTSVHFVASRRMRCSGV